MSGKVIVRIWFVLLLAQGAVAGPLSDRNGPGDDDGLGIDDLYFETEYSFPSSIDGGSGKVGLVRASGAAGLEYETESGVEYSLGGSFLVEDWSYRGTGTGLLAGVARPWKGFEKYALEAGVSYDLTPGWSAMFEAASEWTSERGATTSDTQVFEALLAVSWRVKQNLELNGGVFWQENLVDGHELMAIAGFDWRITEADRLALIDRGDFVELAYSRRLVDRLELIAFGRYADEDYRLAENGPVPGGALSREELQAGLRLERALGPGWLGLALGGAFERTYEIRSSSGGTVQRPELDPGFVLGLSYATRY